MSEVSKKKVEVGNPVIPSPPIPSQVRTSMLPKPPTPIPATTPKVETETTAEKKVEDEVEERVDEKPKGEITIRIFENSPYEVEFSGFIAGNELDLAWRAMMKEYRVWKHKMFNKREEEKKGGSNV